jgi:hypothetical protein
MQNAATVRRWRIFTRGRLYPRLAFYYTAS